jgi:hypothetical protein
MIKKIILLIFLFSSLFLVAQPQNFEWANSIGSHSGNDIGNCIVTDEYGNIYSTGYFYDTVDFDPGPATFNIVSKGASDVFISKLDAAGNFLWAKSVSGPYGQGAHSITLDGSGNIYITGFFWGLTDFDPGVGTFNLTNIYNQDIFILKLDSSGNFVWAKQINESTYEDDGYSITVDAISNVYITGYFNYTADFDPGPGTYNLNNGNIFVLKLDSAGNFVWAKGFGGMGWNIGYSIKVDAIGNVYVAGQFEGLADFDPNTGVYNLISVGDKDAFVVKFNSSGNFVWAKQIGSLGDDRSYSLVLDALNNIYITGYFSQTADFDPGSGIFNLTSAGGNDVFVLKLDNYGNFVWAKKFDGTQGQTCFSIAIDSVNNIYVAGVYSGTVDFDPSISIFNLTASGYGDMFICKLNNYGNFISVIGLGGTGFEIANSIAISPSNDIYTIGDFTETVDFDPGPGIFNLTATSNYNIFIHKISQKWVGINESKNDAGILIYPNPTNSKFSIIINGLVKDAVIEMYNSQGELIFKSLTASRENIIDLTNQALGIYFAKIIKDNNSIVSQKIIKK